MRTKPTNAEYAAALRELADFYDTNPAMQQPHAELWINCYEREAFVSATRTLAHGGLVTKSADPMDASYPQYHSYRNFGVIRVDVNIQRSKVCKLITPAVYDCPDSLLEEMDMPQETV
jgi:hypothetical protein